MKHIITIIALSLGALTVQAQETWNSFGKDRWINNSTGQMMSRDSFGNIRVQQMWPSSKARPDIFRNPYNQQIRGGQNYGNPYTQPQRDPRYGY